MKSMEYRREKDFQAKATYDVYTNYDVSINETYSADQGYPFDYPTRWLNDPSMNKRIGIRRLSCTPSSHSFTLQVLTYSDSPFNKVNTIEVTHADNLVKVLSAMKQRFEEVDDDIGTRTGLPFEYNTTTNRLVLSFVDNMGFSVPFSIISPGFIDGTDEIDDFLRFLNQPVTQQNRDVLTTKSESKVFDEVWDRDLLQFHASFSTSKRKFIGISNDFYMTPSVLYPPPTNESEIYLLVGKIYLLDTVSSI